jgi:hypothetical protein
MLLLFTGCEQALEPTEQARAQLTSALHLVPAAV